jgi:hypothetical protein
VRRIEALGGVLSKGDAPTRLLAYLLHGADLCQRVYQADGQGGLNMTRALGDDYLKVRAVTHSECLVVRALGDGRASRCVQPLVLCP